MEEEIGSLAVDWTDVGSGKVTRRPGCSRFDLRSPAKTGRAHCRAFSLPPTSTVSWRAACSRHPCSGKTHPDPESASALLQDFVHVLDLNQGDVLQHLLRNFSRQTLSRDFLPYLYPVPDVVYERAGRYHLTVNCIFTGTILILLNDHTKAMIDILRRAY